MKNLRKEIITNLTPLVQEEILKRLASEYNLPETSFKLLVYSAKEEIAKKIEAEYELMIGQTLKLYNALYGKMSREECEEVVEKSCIELLKENKSSLRLKSLVMKFADIRLDSEDVSDYVKEDVSDIKLFLSKISKDMEELINNVDDECDCPMCSGKRKFEEEEKSVGSVEGFIKFLKEKAEAKDNKSEIEELEELITTLVEAILEDTESNIAEEENTTQEFEHSDEEIFNADVMVYIEEGSTLNFSLEKDDEFICGTIAENENGLVIRMNGEKRTEQEVKALLFDTIMVGDWSIAK